MIETTICTHVSNSGPSHGLSLVLTHKDEKVTHVQVATNTPARALHPGHYTPDIRYKVLWIGEIVKHKGIAKSKVLQGKKKAKVLHIYRLPHFDLLVDRWNLLN